MTLYLPHHKTISEHAFAIIDKATVNSKLAERYSTLDIVSEQLQPQAHLYPSLLDLAAIPSPDWGTVIDEISQQETTTTSPVHQINLLLESELPITSLRVELVSALLITDSNEQNAILRYYDPRVLCQLSWMLTPWQLYTLLRAHVIPSWTYRLEDQWHTLHFPQPIAYQPGDPIALPLAQIERIGLINQILNHHATATLSERISLSKMIEKLLQQAELCGLTHPKDVVSFTAHGLKHDCAFWRHQEIKKILHYAKHTVGTYHRMTSKISQDMWHKIETSTPMLPFH